MVMFWFFPVVYLDLKLCPIFNIHLNTFSLWSYSCVISHRLLHTLLPQGLFFLSLNVLNMKETFLGMEYIYDKMFSLKRKT